MKWLIVLMLISLTLVPRAAIIKDTVSTVEELQQIFSKKVDSVIIYLTPGIYELTPKNFIDSSCGNCEKGTALIPVTYGLMLKGRYIRIIGLSNKRPEIITNSGYGIFLNKCDYCEIKNLAITGGTRDTSGKATSAAIVAKFSKGSIDNNLIHDNIGDSATLASTIAGIMGICVRDNSNLRIINNHIIRNSWDGIAVYKDSRGFITKNLIDGVDKATGTTPGGGRGVGIGLTWNAEATVINNLVKRYWKGIGVFVNAEGYIKNNIVEDILTWGIAVWDAEKGLPYASIKSNVVYKTGACGISISSRSPENPAGELSENIICETAQNEKYDSPEYYCTQAAIAKDAVPKFFLVKENVLYNNRELEQGEEDPDLSDEEFRERIKSASLNFRFALWWKYSDFLKKYLF